MTTRRPSATDMGTPNYASAFAGREDVYTAWLALVAAVRSHVDDRTYRLASLAAALRLGSSYCSLAHGTALAQETGLDVVRVVSEPASSGLSPRDQAVLAFAERVVASASTVSPPDHEPLRRLDGDPAVSRDVALVVALRCFFSTYLDAMGVQADSHYLQQPRGVRDALVVGRPIEDQVVR